MCLFLIISLIESVNDAQFQNIACLSFLSAFLVASFAPAIRTMMVPLTSMYVLV